MVNSLLHLASVCEEYNYKPFGDLTLRISKPTNLLHSRFAINKQSCGSEFCAAKTTGKQMTQILDKQLWHDGKLISYDDLVYGDVQRSLAGA